MPQQVFSRQSASPYRLDPDDIPPLFLPDVLTVLEALPPIACGERPNRKLRCGARKPCGFGTPKPLTYLVDLPYNHL